MEVEMEELPVNQILCGDCLVTMQSFPSDSVDLVVTSPPYWGLRDYGVETVRVWGGFPECEHEWVKTPPPRQRNEADIKDPTSKQATMRGTNYNAQEGNICAHCGAWRGSLGLEPHPQLFIDHLVEICREVKRVLKPSGTFWLNLGDTYCSSGKWVNKELGDIGKQNRSVEGGSVDAYSMRGKLKPDGGWIQPKQLLMIPARVAIALQDDGWILRNDIIWHKPNHMPSSVKDRLTCAYEHLFLFAKARRYYFDLDAIRVPHSYPETFGSRPDLGKAGDTQYAMSPGKRIGNIKGKNPGDVWDIEDRKLTKHDRAVDRTNRSYTDPLHAKEYHPKGKNPGDVLSGSKYLEQDHPHSIRVKGGHTGDYTHPKGKNPGDLWRIQTTPFPGAHFATFPPKLIKPIIKAGCPRWICSRCGKPRTRITMRKGQPPKIGKSKRGEAIDFTGSDTHRKSGQAYQNWLDENPKITVGWSDCGCEADWVGGIVLDPFAGSGTALRVSRRLGRGFIGIEINPEYAAMCERRVRSDAYQPPPEGVQPLTEIFDNEQN